MSAGRQPRVCVFGPAPLLTVAVEATAVADENELHLHVGGQGFWIARLITELGPEVAFCTAVGGETGRVIRSLLEDEHLEVRCIEANRPNGAYVDDRRSGERVRVA